MVSIGQIVVNLQIVQATRYSLTAHFTLNLLYNSTVALRGSELEPDSHQKVTVRSESSSISDVSPLWNNGGEGNKEMLVWRAGKGEKRRIAALVDNGNTSTNRIRLPMFVASLAYSAISAYLSYLTGTHLKNTVRINSLPHRKWKETKQQPGTAGPGNMLGCCLVSINFLWGKLSMRTVDQSTT